MSKTKKRVGRPRGPASESSQAGKAMYDAHMRTKGYIHIVVAASILKVAASTLHRWARDGLVKRKLVMSRVYIDIASLVKHVGPDIAQLTKLAD